MKDLKKAAQWWLDTTKDLKNDCGDDKLNFMFKAVQEVTPAITKEQSEKFIENFISVVSKEKQERNIYIGVDYSPGTILSDVLEGLGIDDKAFPVKTNMAIYPGGEIEVSHGYAAKYVEI